MTDSSSPAPSGPSAGAIHAPDLATIANTERWPRQLADLTDLVAQEIARFKATDAGATRLLACAIVTRIALEYGGSALYVPKSDAIARALRNLAIWAAHDGTVDGPCGIHALARTYNMSGNAIWDILRQERALHRRR
jgi:Mor family transcriptional regulator